ncbi:S8 family peptidase [Candidatus Bipolaricaulota sp. J31]
MSKGFRKFILIGAWVILSLLVLLGTSGRSPLDRGGTLWSVPEGGAPRGAGGSFLPARDAVQWGLAAIKAPTAWRVTSGSAEVVVAVIDSGIDYSIPELAAVMWRNPGEIPENGIDDDGNGYVDDVHGWDFRDNDPSSLEGTPIYWHGTFVAGLIAATYNPLFRTGGVAPGVRIMDLRFLDSRGLFYTRDWEKLIRAIDYAVENGARIINLSIYSQVIPPAGVRRALRRAVEAGVLVVGIAGNTGARVGYFGRWPEVVAVGAVDEGGRVASFSNRGPEVALVGPGVGVVSQGLDGLPRTASGTSFAAPHVAGVAALLLSIRPDLSPSQILEFLRATAKDLGELEEGHGVGAGLVDAAAAVEAVRASLEKGELFSK